MWPCDLPLELLTLESCHATNLMISSAAPLFEVHFVPEFAQQQCLCQCEVRVWAHYKRLSGGCHVGRGGKFQIEAFWWPPKSITSLFRRIQRRMPCLAGIRARWDLWPRRQSTGKTHTSTNPRLFAQTTHVDINSSLEISHVSYNPGSTGPEL